jgi:hypothetical protein
MSQELRGTAFEPALCPLCGRQNDCQLCRVDSHKGPCWCANMTVPEELLALVAPELKNRACICRQCVADFWERHESASKAIPVRDFYFDKDGLMVFTAEYHLRRGYCCGSGCRHCPYPIQSESEQFQKST